MKVISWNVNGIRAAINKGFVDSIKSLDCDVVCLQETKAHPEQLDSSLKELGYESEIWNSAEKKGYSGTAVFSKVKPLNVTKGIGHELDNEGRVLTLEFDSCYIVTVYTPNSKDDLSRLQIRYDEWDPLFLKYCSSLEKKKPVIFCGDLNAAHKALDVKNDKANQTTEKKPGNPGFTDQEREGIDNILNEKFIDTFRFFFPDEEKFSWWSYRGGARERNVGWRIDYVFVSETLKNKLKNASIHNEIFGSDHCPVSIEVDIKL